MKRQKGWLMIMGLFLTFCSILGLSGCKKIPGNTVMDPSLLKTEKIAAVSYSCSHMDRLSAFRFSLEKMPDGTFFYQAEWGDREQEILLQMKKNLSEADWRELQKLIEAEDLIQKLCTLEKEPNAAEVQDRTSYIFRISWEDGTQLSGSSSEQNEAATAFFFDFTRK